MNYKEKKEHNENIKDLLLIRKKELKEELEGDYECLQKWWGEPEVVKSNIEYIHNKIMNLSMAFLDFKN